MYKQMKKIAWRLGSLLFALLLLVSCNSDDNFIDQGGNIQEEISLNVSYGEHEQQVYDLYLPEGRSAENTKVLVLIHGGGWIDGDKADMQEAVNLIRERHPDHAVANVNYVLANTNTPAFPNQFIDVVTIIEQLTEQSDSLHINPTFGLIGASAGAHIALMVDYNYDTEDQVKFVGDIVGPTDFTDPFYSEDPNFEILLNLLVDESQYEEGIDLVEAISPAFQVSSNSSPNIMFYGNTEPLVPITNAYTINNALDTAEIDNSLTIFDGGHGDDWSEAEIASMYVKLSGYIDTYLSVETP